MTLDYAYLAYEPIVNDYANEEEPDPALRARCHEHFMKSINGKKVLEVGCGPGHDAAKFRDAGCNVTATDLCQGFISYAQRKYADIDFQCMDLQEPTFAPNSFDGVYGASCFCHIPTENISCVLKKYHTILRPEGFLFLLLADSEQVDGYIVEDWGGVEGNKVEMVCHHRDTINAQVIEAGFEQSCITPMRSPFYEELPRLKELGIRVYAISAFKAAGGN